MKNKTLSPPSLFLGILIFFLYYKLKFLKVCFPMYNTFKDSYFPAKIKRYFHFFLYTPFPDFNTSVIGNSSKEPKKEKEQPPVTSSGHGNTHLQ